MDRHDGPQVTQRWHSIRCYLLLCLILAPAAAATEPTRNLLWVTLQTCILTKRMTGRALPCLAVDLGDKDRPGTAVLRAPGQATHVVVMPTERVVGLEDPQLQQRPGTAYWQAALAARHYVTEALGGRLTAYDVGLAVNSIGGRSQDQLHIHLDCVQPSVQAALQHYASTIGSTWAAMPIALQGSRFFALRVGADQMRDLNPFAALGHLPGRRTELRDTSLAMISVSGESGTRDFVLLAYRDPEAHAEKLLDHACTALAKAAAK
ncbi:CDP-diacylglycerol diphosphatase [Methylobacterium nodulans]|uniref:CDP-diacylglycerol pyrophosphatase n=1 Tax=Methylobacterium nodulans (strain LMG 21967 / CNCM I-2342 / ORS 2060) TaxID=460265 RepID=B8IMH8_METNO|nr:CDP-diacylglycerol diphosphatase [Methylobacterium nodulans]ACL58364.1 CDP-diacylglycerol pyrophosphatase [Methylobacterium nodulans ORS 2060]